jgi:heme/copper-type cytochrome/quinol oxidase subunit 2
MQPNSSIKFQPITFGIVVCLFLISHFTNAQCAMCRASLESSGKTTQVEAVNDGIVYLMAIPYILVAAMGIFIYRLYTKRK